MLGLDMYDLGLGRIWVQIFFQGRAWVGFSNRFDTNVGDRVRCFVVTERPKGGGAVCEAALRKKKVEEWHPGCGWKGGCVAC